MLCLNCIIDRINTIRIRFYNISITMKSFCTIILSLCFLYSHAQFNPEKVNRKAAQLYSQALQIAEDGDFNRSIGILQQAVKIDPKFADAWLSMAGMYGELKNYDAAIQNYERARSIDSLYFKDYNLPYSINLAGKGWFDKALQAVNQFLGISKLNETSRKAAEYRRKSYQFAIDYAASHKNDYKFQPTNLGDNINSNVSEYYPTITIDGKELVFTRRVNNFNEDFYGANLEKQGWSGAKGLSGKTKTH